MRKRLLGRLDRTIDAAVLGLLPVGQQSDLITALRSSEGARARYDRAVEAFRVLEDRDIAEVEYDLVERWLHTDGLLAAAPIQDDARVVERWLGFIGVAVAMAAALVLVFGPLRPPVEDDGMLARGAHGRRGLAIEALCPGALGRVGRADGVAFGLQPASVAGCARSSTLSFAYLAEQGVGDRQETLSLFGIDADGDVMYYMPTPSDPAPVVIAAGAWQPLPVAVDLSVNHIAGDLRLYGIVTPKPLSVADIDGVAVALRRMPPAQAGDLPWHERVPSTSNIAAVCTTGDGCNSAELSFRIHDGNPVPRRPGDLR